MDDIDIDLYDNLEVIPNKFEQEKSDLIQKFDQLKLEYDQVKQELDEIRGKYDAANSCEKSFRTLRANFDSVMLTAQSEIGRLKRQLDVIRKEKDDLVFRRARPKTVPVNVRDFSTQTSIRQVSNGVQTDDVDRRWKRDDCSSRDTRRPTEHGMKRPRSRSRDKSSRGSSKQSGSENERKRPRNDRDDHEKRDEASSRHHRRRSREKDKQRETVKQDKKTPTRTMATRKLTRISERRVSERQKTPEKSQSKSKRKSKTPKKVDVDPVEQELETLMAGHVQESKKVIETNGKAPEKTKQRSDKTLSKNDSVQDLRKLLEAKKVQRVVSEIKPVPKKEKLPVRPLELLWQERQVESNPDESQNTSDLFACQNEWPLSTAFQARQRTQRTLLQDLYSDTESAPYTQKSKEPVTKSLPSVDLENDEIVESIDKTKVDKANTKPVKAKKSKQKDFAKKKSPSVPNTTADKKYASKIVPGTVDDSACDLGEIIQKQTTLVEHEIGTVETVVKVPEACLPALLSSWDSSEVVKAPPELTVIEPETDKEVNMKKSENLIELCDVASYHGHRSIEACLPSLPVNLIDLVKEPEPAVTEVETEKEVDLQKAEDLIELCDVASQETVSEKKVSPVSLIGQRSIDSLIMQNFGDQSNISLLIAADIFLQNDNTMKSVEEKVNESPDSPTEGDFNGFSSQEIQASPRNNSNDSLKENICTPLSNKSQNALHGSTPNTMTKSEPKQLLTQLNNGPDSSIPTPDTSKEITGEHQLSVASNDSLNSSAKRRIIETKSTQYVVEETEDMVICTVNRKKRQKEKKEKKSKHKHKEKERRSIE